MTLCAWQLNPITNSPLLLLTVHFYWSIFLLAVFHLSSPLLLTFFVVVVVVVLLLSALLSAHFCPEICIGWVFLSIAVRHNTLPTATRSCATVNTQQTAASVAAYRWLHVPGENVSLNHVNVFQLREKQNLRMSSLRRVMWTEYNLESRLRVCQRIASGDKPQNTFYAKATKRHARTKTK